MARVSSVPQESPAAVFLARWRRSHPPAGEKRLGRTRSTGSEDALNVLLGEVDLINAGIPSLHHAVVTITHRYMTIEIFVEIFFTEFTVETKIYYEISRIT